jgi:probable rRNA maturation factor
MNSRKMQSFMHNIIIENVQDKLVITQEHEKLIREVIKECLKNEHIEKDAEVNVIITDNADITDINSLHRGIQKATDVLSFPLLEYADGKADITQSDINPENGCVLYGDIIVSIEKTIEQAEEYGHSFECELGFLVAHGMHHLMGYDHETDSEELVMISKQETVLEKLNLTRS